MPQARNWSARFLALILLAGTCAAQNAEPAKGYKFYKLDFLVKEVEAAKVVNSRAYSVMISTDPRVGPSSIRTGSRVPVPASTNSTSFSYIDVGVNIDCRSAQEVDGQLSLLITADISSMLQEPAANPPVVRQNKWTSMVVVPLRKPVVLFASDDTTSKRQMQLELTATLIR